MAKKSKVKKFYAVRKGRTTGVFHSWAECERQTKGYSGAIFKSFPSIAAAEDFVGSRVPKGPNTSNIVSKPHQPGQKRGNETKNADISEVTKRRKFSDGGKTGEESSLRSSSPTTLSILIHFDGGSRGNPGVAGAGSHLQVKERVIVNNKNEKSCQTGNESSILQSQKYVYAEKEKTIKIRKFCGCNSTNNVAEYQGLLCGLKEASTLVQEYCTNLPKSENARIAVDIRGDSNLVINQIHGLYACKHPNLKPLCAEAKEQIRLLESFSKCRDTDYGNIVIDTSFEHVYRSNNRISDALANEAMDAKKSWSTSTCVDNTDETTICSRRKTNRSPDYVFSSHSHSDKLGSGEFDVEEV